MDNIADELTDSKLLVSLDLPAKVAEVKSSDFDFDAWRLQFRDHLKSVIARVETSDLDKDQKRKIRSLKVSMNRAMLWEIECTRKLEMLSKM